MLQIFQGIVNFLTALANVPPQYYSVLGASLTTILGTQVTKKLLALEHNGVIVSVMGTFALIFGGIGYLLANQGHLPPSLAAFLSPQIYSGVTVATVATGLFHFYRLLNNGVLSKLLAGLKSGSNQPQDKVLTTDGSGGAVYTAPSSTETPATTQLPESKF